MKTSQEIKESVKEKYSEIALQSREENSTSCCGAGGCGQVDYEIFSEDYSKLDGHVQDADLGLGCGIPTAFAQITKGQTVLDLGSGAGNDCFVARELVGSEGKVIGVDMTEVMVDKARENADKLKFNNVEFRLGDIEALPVGGMSIDVVISNCVLNLVPDKDQAFKEMFRVLRPGGHFSVSDVVLKGELPENLKNDAEMYAGCVSGAIQRDDYLNKLSAAGFSSVEVQKEKKVIIPDDILRLTLSEEELEKFKHDDIGIYSITVYGKRPTELCEPGSGCC